MDITLERILSLIPKKKDGKFLHGAKKEFAQTIGLKSGNLISDWINGRSESYKGYLYEISAKYGVSIEWLRGETDEKDPAAVGEITDEQLKFALFGDAAPEITDAQLNDVKRYAKFIINKG